MGELNVTYEKLLYHLCIEFKAETALTDPLPLMLVKNEVSEDDGDVGGQWGVGAGGLEKEAELGLELETKPHVKPNVEREKTGFHPESSETKVGCEARGCRRRGSSPTLPDVLHNVQEPRLHAEPHSRLQVRERSRCRFRLKNTLYDEHGTAQLF